MSKQNEAIATDLAAYNWSSDKDYQLAVIAFKELLPGHISKAVIEERKEKFRILESLCDMYEQYCGGKTGHDFMGAGEGAISILEDYGLSKVVFHIADDWELTLAELKAKQELHENE